MYSLGFSFYFILATILIYLGSFGKLGVRPWSKIRARHKLTTRIFGHFLPVTSIWPTPAASTTHRNLSNSANTIFYGFVMAMPKWVPNRPYCPLCIKLIISTIFHIILTHLAVLL